MTCITTLIGVLKHGHSPLEMLLQLWFHGTISFFIVHVYSPSTRKQIVFLSFGQDVRTHLGVVIFDRSVEATCLPHIGPGIPLNVLPKDTASEPAGLFPTTSFKCKTPSRETVDRLPFF